MSRTLLATMTVPIPFPDPARGDEAVSSSRDAVPAVVAALAVAAGTTALGVLAGLSWAAVAPRPLLVITAPGAAALVNAETTAFIAADAAFCLVCLAGGAISGALGLWALAAGVVAGGLELLASPGRHRTRRIASVVRHVDGPAGEGAGSID